MRTIGNILLILFVIVSIYIVKDDALSLLRKAKNEIGKVIVKSDLVDGLSQPEKTINTPGPLKALSNLLNKESGQLTARGVIEFTNKARNDNGALPALVENKKLDASAQAKVDDMFAKQYFEHISPNGTGVADLAEAADYEYIIIGENLALGNFKSDEDLVTAWMNSPGHRANILNNRYKEIGVAVRKGEFQGNMVWLAVQHFGMPKSACPTIDQNLKLSIQSDEAKLKAIEEELNATTSSPNWSNRTKEEVDAYNEKVASYNSLVVTTRDLITKYNKQVKTFNACAQGS